MTPSPSPKSRTPGGRDTPGRLIRHLREIFQRDDRAALATLRKAMQHPNMQDPAVFPEVVPFVRPDAYEWELRAHLIVAGLFGMHPGDPTQGLSLATALRKVRSARDSGSIEARFVALLRAHEDDLAVQLRHAVSLVAHHSSPLPLNYQELLKHLLQWSHPDGWVQRRWARDFWAAPQSAVSQDTTNSTTNSTTSTNTLQEGTTDEA